MKISQIVLTENEERWAIQETLMDLQNMLGNLNWDNPLRSKFKHAKRTFSGAETWARDRDAHRCKNELEVMMRFFKSGRDLLKQA